MMHILKITSLYVSLLLSFIFTFPLQSIEPYTPDVLNLNQDFNLFLKIFLSVIGLCVLGGGYIVLKKSKIKNVKPTITTKKPSKSKVEEPLNKIVISDFQKKEADGIFSDLHARYTFGEKFTSLNNRKAQKRLRKLLSADSTATSVLNCKKVQMVKLLIKQIQIQISALKVRAPNSHFLQIKTKDLVEANKFIVIYTVLV